MGSIPYKSHRIRFQNHRGSRIAAALYSETGKKRCLQHKERGAEPIDLGLLEGHPDELTESQYVISWRWFIENVGIEQLKEPCGWSVLAEWQLEKNETYLLVYSYTLCVMRFNIRTTCWDTGMGEHESTFSQNPFQRHQHFLKCRQHSGLERHEFRITWFVCIWGWKFHGITSRQIFSMRPCVHISDRYTIADSQCMMCSLMQHSKFTFVICMKCEECN